MSRIPVPTHNPRAPSPALSGSVHSGPNTTMSSLSGLQSPASLSETRKKQSKRDEVSFSPQLIFIFFILNNRLFEKKSNQSSRGNVLYPLPIIIGHPNAVGLEASLHLPRELSPLLNPVRH